METMNQLKVYKPNTGLLHWLHVMISKRPGTVESPGGIHRRRHQKRRKDARFLVRKNSVRNLLAQIAETASSLRQLA